MQYGVAVGLESLPEYVDKLRSQYRHKRDIICNGLADAGLTPLAPQGAYYVLADIAKFGYADTRTAAMALLEQTGLAGVPGTSFYQGEEGECLIRFCFAKGDRTLNEAVHRLSAFRPG